MACDMVKGWRGLEHNRRRKAGRGSGVESFVAVLVLIGDDLAALGAIPDELMMMRYREDECGESQKARARFSSRFLDPPPLAGELSNMLARRALQSTRPQGLLHFTSNPCSAYSSH